MEAKADIAQAPKLLDQVRLRPHWGGLSLFRELFCGLTQRKHQLRATAEAQLAVDRIELEFNRAS